LLDDLEEVAHGNLTIQSDTSGDVLGCIADVLNLIIENQREIVKQLPPDAPIRNRFRLPE
jgi:methyl-accepting chemotaxis protein